jgi:transposase-like protein
MAKGKILQDAIKYFSDEQVCIDTVVALRWEDGKPTCPSCEKKDHYYLKTQKRWKCKECGRQFSVKLGTIFEDSPITLDKWLIALWMLVNCRNGVSSYEIARDLGITQKSAWFVLQRLRLALQTGSVTKLGGNGTPVEVDETFIGGKARFMHKRRRIKMTTVGKLTSKAVVMGMLERGGKVKASVIAERKRHVVDAIVRENVLPETEVHTDEFPGY